MFLIVEVALLGACRAANEDAQAISADSARERGEPVALPVVGSLVERGDLVITIRTSGRVRSDRLVSLKSETQGTVAEVNLRPGDRVAAGTVLARFDPRPFDLAVREAEGALADTRVRYNDLILGDRQGDTSEVTRVRQENARLRSGMIGAEARLERAQLDRESATFRAPFAGVVDDIGVVPGQRVGAGEFVARVVDVANLVIEANVLEHDLGLLRPGGTATVMPNAGDGRRYQGQIAAVLPMVDTATRAGRALIRVRSQGSLRPGMYADLELESERLRGRVLVPAAAVIERDGRPLVFRVRGDKAEWVYVQLGRSNRRTTEILPDSASNVAPPVPGDTVLIAGHLTLIHDATVRVTTVARPTN